MKTGVPHSHRFPWRPYVVLLGAIVLLGLGPLLSAMLAELVADLNDCRLEESEGGTCMVFGLDLGGVLYAMFVLGWLSLVSIPLGAVGLAAWLVVLAISIAVHRRRRAAALSAKDPPDDRTRDGRTRKETDR